MAGNNNFHSYLPTQYAYPPPPHLNNASEDHYLVPWQPPPPPVPGFYAPGAGYWQQPPPFQAFLPERPKEKVGLDTVITALWGPERRPDRQWCFVRPHLTRRQQRSSSESTIEIPRPFPIPTGRRVASDARTRKWAEDIDPPLLPASPPPPGSESSASPPPSPRPRRERHVKERRRRVIVQYDGPASGDKRKRRERRGGQEREMEDVTTEITHKHYCIRCGRPRSRKYHSRHPWGPGIKPDVGVCRRCDGTFFREPKELTPPASPKEEVIISESESIEEEVIVRKRVEEFDGTADNKGAQSRHSSQFRKHRKQKSESMDSLTTFAPPSEHGDDSKSTQKKPVITRRLIYRYVPDEERTMVKPATTRKTQITIEEQAAASSRSGRSPEPKGAILLASHPGAWSRGKMIMVDEHLEESSESSSSSESEAEKDPASNQEPEWYFRRYTRTRAPLPPESSRRPPAARPAIEPRQDYEDFPPRHIRRPLRGILQPSMTPRPAMRYREEELGYDEDDDKSTYFDKNSRVSFAPGTKRGGRATAEPCTTPPARAQAAVMREEESLHDWYEAQDDRDKKRRIKNRVRHEAIEDGGPYMELDGHYSDGDGGRVKKSRKKISTRSKPETTLPPRSPPYQTGFAQDRFATGDQTSHTVNERSSLQSFRADSLSFDEPVMVTSYPARVRTTPRSMFASSAHSRETSHDISPLTPASPGTPGADTSCKSERSGLASRRVPSGVVPRLKDISKRISPKRGGKNSTDNSPGQSPRLGAAFLSSKLPTPISPMSPRAEEGSYFYLSAGKHGADQHKIPMNTGKTRAKSPTRLQNLERDIALEDLPPLPPSPRMRSGPITPLSPGKVNGEDPRKTVSVDGVVPTV